MILSSYNSPFKFIEDTFEQYKNYFWPIYQLIEESNTLCWIQQAVKVHIALEIGVSIPHFCKFFLAQQISIQIDVVFIESSAPFEPVGVKNVDKYRGWLLIVRILGVVIKERDLYGASCMAFNPVGT